MIDPSKMTDRDSDGLRFYIAYDYLTAEETSRLLLASHSIYESLFWAPLPAMLGARRDRRRALQVREIHTGNSVYIDLVNTLGQAVSGLDPSLTGVGGGVVVAALTARVMINALSLGHRALSAARTRDIEISEQRLELQTKSRNANFEGESRRLEIRSSVAEAEMREFVHELIRTTTNVDFARSLEQDLPLTDVVGGALLDAYSVIQHDNIIHAAINGEMVKGKNHEFLDDDSKAE